MRNSHARDTLQTSLQLVLLKSQNLFVDKKNPRIEGLVTRACSHASLSLGTVVFWTPGREEILQILLDGFLLLTFFCLFTLHAVRFGEPYAAHIIK